MKKAVLLLLISLVLLAKEVKGLAWIPIFSTEFDDLTGMIPFCCVRGTGCSYTCTGDTTVVAQDGYAKLYTGSDKLMLIEHFETGLRNFMILTWVNPSYDTDVFFIDLFNTTESKYITFYLDKTAGLFAVGLLDPPYRTGSPSWAVYNDYTYPWANKPQIYATWTNLPDPPWLINITGVWKESLNLIYFTIFVNGQKMIEAGFGAAPTTVSGMTLGIYKDYSYGTPTLIDYFKLYGGIEEEQCQTCPPPPGCSISCNQNLFHRYTSTNAYYTLNLPTRQTVEITLDPSETVDYDLYTVWSPNTCPNVVWDCRPYLGTGQEEVCSAVLDPGTYYIRVNRYSGYGEYNLFVYCTPPPTTTTTTIPPTTTTTIPPTTTTLPPPQPTKIRRTCEFSATYPSNTYFSCDMEGIQLPTNAINIRATTKAYITITNGIMNNSAKTFEMKSCSPAAGVGEDGEKCEIKFLPCTIEGQATTLTRYRTALPGEYISSNVHANISLNCIQATGSPTYVKINGITEVEYDLVPVTEKRVSITVYPESGNETTLFHVYVSTYNLDYPYNLTLVVDGEEWNLGLKYTQNWEVVMNFYNKPGTHTVYFKVKDSRGWVGVTDTKTITVFGRGVSPFTLSVTPEEGSVTTPFRFTTSLIRDGIPPYYVVVFPVKYGKDARIGSCTLPSSGVCSFSTTLPCGNETYIAEAMDSTGSVAYSNVVAPRVLCEPLGEPLNVTLTVSPSRGDTQTIFNFTLTIRGGRPPYYVSWDNFGNMMCYETYVSDPPIYTSRRFRFSAGAKGISVHVTSSDGQLGRSNRINLDIGWAGYTRDTVYDCTGTIGEWVERGEITTTTIPTIPPTVPKPIPIVNETEWKEAGFEWALFFFSPVGLITITSLFFFAIISRISGWVFGVVGFIFLWFILAYFTGILPSWLFITLVIIAGFIIANLVRQMVMGK